MDALEEAVSLEYLRKYGFERYPCKRCGGHMWSLIPREECPDRPCSKYEFLYKKYPRVAPLSVQEVRKKFIEFLRSRGHGVLEPYPVLARWRDDLYLTIASIIVFQPHVTDGLVDPPYNPLVIVQPSVRLADIDDVGLTFGRHLTSFEMGGMHAFNSDRKFVYWVEGVIDNTYDFFVKEIGIEPEDLVFKESWWEGGGNAGPAPEVLVDGMELATLVFMMYKYVDGKLVRNPLKVVDCGYGMERIAWFTQRTPTGFHAIYGSLVERFKDLLGVEEPPHDVLRKMVYELSDKEYKGMTGLVALLRGLGYGEYERELTSSIYMYAALDHTRTLGLMLADGIVPSNSGEGYLARLVFRRLARILAKLGIKLNEVGEKVLDLLEEQAKYWKDDYVFGKIHRSLGYIEDVVRVEANKYVDSMARGVEIVERVLRRRDRLSVDDVIGLYDSHGIPPDAVLEAAKSRGIEVEVPEDFYSMVAARHSSPPSLGKSEKLQLDRQAFEWASRYPPTRALFHEDPYVRRAVARVLGVMGNMVILDSTIFYPRSGGQDSDRGLITINGRTYEVNDVLKVGDVVVHVLNGAVIASQGDAAVLELDWRRRYALMRHHTATHLLLGVARMLLGAHVKQAGAEKTVERGRLDITHYKTLSRDEAEKIEAMVNKLIDEGVDVVAKEMTRFEAEKVYGTRIYEGGPVYSSSVRVVEIPGVDAEACYGTHVRNTREVGGFKIIGIDRIQDGVLRFEFVAGPAVASYASRLEKAIDDVANVLGARGDLMSAAAKVVSELKSSEGLLSAYRRALSEELVAVAEERAKEISGIKYVAIELPVNDEALRRKVVEELALKRGYVALIKQGEVVEIAIKPELARKRQIDLRALADRLREKGIRGGGKEDHVVLRLGPGSGLDDVERALAELLKRV
ncbi:MAG: alanine--tRNA ligase [Desulfurococcaceae archaeon]